MVKAVTIRQIVDAAARLASSADRLSATFADLLAEVLADTNRRLVPLVTDAADSNRTAIVKAARAERTRREIRAILEAAGYDDLATAATDAPLDTILAQVLKGRRLAKQSAELAASAQQRVDALKLLNLGDLLEEGDSLAYELWKATVRGVFGSRPADDILQDLAAVTGRKQSHIRTLYDTSLSIFGRQVEALQAGDEPDTVFLYVGPVDEKTRDFCLERVGKVFTRSEIDAMDNGQLNDVFLTGGGYNCRHVFHEVSKFSELQDYIGTDKRVPEVQQQLDDLAEAA